MEKRLLEILLIMENQLLDIFLILEKRLLEIFLIMQKRLLEIFLIVIRYFFISQEMKMFEEIHPCLSIVDNLKFGKTMMSNL